MRVVETSARHVCNITAEQKQKAAAQIKKLQKEGEKLIHGMFEFPDAQGGWLDFSYRWYPGEPIRTVHIVHGEITDIPLDLARHLNNTYKKVRKIRENADSGKDVIEKTSRTRFIPMDVIDPAILKAM